jgi:alpha(1,3/1,4) fucosyltransferase
MDKIKLAFKYMPREATKEDNYFYNLLNKNFEIELSEEPDFILFSTFNGNNTKEIPNIKEKVTTIFWTGENIRINMKKYDYAFGFDYEKRISNKNYLRLPLYAYFGAGKNLIKNENFNPENILNQKTKFCNYTYSKDAQKRVEFFKELSKYKKINAPGKSMNNSTPITPNSLSFLLKPLQLIEGISEKYPLSSMISRHFSNWRKEVINYQKQFKFTIAFENASYPGYTTEKIYHPMLANSIPIYWGNPEIKKDFNTKSFVNWHEYNDHKKVVDIVIDLDQNNKKYTKMLKEPWFNKNKPNKWCEEERIIKQFDKIFKRKKIITK